MGNGKTRKRYSYDLYIDGELDSSINPLFKTQKQCFDYILNDILLHKIPRRFAYRDLIKTSRNKDSDIKTTNIGESIEIDINIMPDKIYLSRRQNNLLIEYEFVIKTVDQERIENNDNTN